MSLSRLLPYATAGMLAVATPVYSQSDDPVQMQQTAQGLARNLAKIVLEKHTRKMPVTRIEGFPPHQREEPTGAIAYWFDIDSTKDMRRTAIKFVDNGDGIPGKGDILEISQPGGRSSYGFIRDEDVDGFIHPRTYKENSQEAWVGGRPRWREEEERYINWNDEEITRMNKEYTLVMQELIKFLEADTKGKKD
jgi:hypothetical protein